MIRTCPIFKSIERKFIAALSTKLVPEVYLPSQFIVIAGYVSHAMFFISRGRVQIIKRSIKKGGAHSTGRAFDLEECHDFFDVVSLFRSTQVRSPLDLP